MTHYQRIRIEVRPSPETNDHEVRLFGDDDDLLSRLPEVLGMDPDDILGEASPLRASDVPHRATVARCDCGEAGCGSAEVEIVRREDLVVWTPDARDSYSFSAAAYDAEVERAIHDTSWETPERTAGRLCALGVNRERLAESGLQFRWASGRVRDGCFTVSLHRDPDSHQVLVHLPWRDESPQEIADAMNELLSCPPDEWDDVERPGWK
jgi:hypothetical protein